MSCSDRRDTDDDARWKWRSKVSHILIVIAAALWSIIYIRHSQPRPSSKTRFFGQWKQEEEEKEEEEYGPKIIPGPKSPSSSACDVCFSAMQVPLTDGDDDDDDDNDESVHDLVRHAVDEIRRSYAHAIHNSTMSHHYFTRMAPSNVRDAVEALLWNRRPEVMNAIRRHLYDGTRHCHHHHHHRHKNNDDRDGDSTTHSEVYFVRDSYDEIYITRPEFDLVDQLKVHYDGNLKIKPPITLPFMYHQDSADLSSSSSSPPSSSTTTTTTPRMTTLCTIRALTYLSGPSVEFVALSSRRKFSTQIGSAILLDFNNELHYADTRNLPQTDATRIMLKTALHVVIVDDDGDGGGGGDDDDDDDSGGGRHVPSSETHATPVGGTWTNAAPTTRLILILYVGAHRLIFFVIKSLRSFIEAASSSSLSSSDDHNGADGPDGFGVLLGMIIDNTMRSLNKIHMVLPLLCVGIPVSFVLMAPLRFPFQFVSYLLYVVLGVCWNVPLSFANDDNHRPLALVVCVWCARLWAQARLRDTITTVTTTGRTRTTMIRRVDTNQKSTSSPYSSRRPYGSFDALSILRFLGEIIYGTGFFLSLRTFVLSLAVAARGLDENNERQNHGSVMSMVLLELMGMTLQLVPSSSERSTTTRHDAVERSGSTSHCQLQFHGRNNGQIAYIMTMHLAWTLITYGYIQRNAEMARHILLAPVEFLE